MRRLKILQSQDEFDSLYAAGIPSTDVVLIKDTNKILLSTNNVDGEYTEYENGGIDASTIAELGLLTVNDASVFALIGPNSNKANIYVGSPDSSEGYSFVSRRLHNDVESISKFGNVDFKTVLINRVGETENARLVFDHTGLQLGFSQDISTRFPNELKHVANIEDTSANFALKSELDGLVDSNDISVFVSMAQVESQGYLKQNNVSTFVTAQYVQNNISTFISEDLNDPFYRQSDGPFLTESDMADHDAGLVATVTEDVSVMIDFDPEDPFLKQSEFDLSDYVATDMLDDYATKEDISVFLKPNDVSNHALKSELDYIVWQGTQAQYELLATHTDYKIYLITE